MTTVPLVRTTRVVVARNLLHIRRAPDLLIVATVQPVLFVLLFGFVFGSAISVPGTDYLDFLMAGVFCQTVAFGSALTGIGLAEDLERGVVDRFRSLPMPRGTVLLARVVSNMCTSLLGIAIMTLCGLIVGWRAHGGLLHAGLGIGLLLLFGHAMSWVSVTIGCLVRSTEVAQSACYVWLFPFAFVSNAFVPTAGMDGVLRRIAEWNPISAVTTSSRDLFGNAAAGSGSWAELHAGWLAAGWCVLLIAVFLPLSLFCYQRRTER
jgi:ABC-2 type transport system permease protein